jgi:hypothetical protein
MQYVVNRYAQQFAWRPGCSDSVAPSGILQSRRRYEIVVIRTPHRRIEVSENYGWTSRRNDVVGHLLKLQVAQFRERGVHRRIRVRENYFDF